MDEESVNTIDEEQDSLEWGVPSKGTKKKVYGNMLKAPKEFGKKIMIAKLGEKLALGEIDQKQYNDYVDATLSG